MYLYERIDEQPELKDSSIVLEEFYEEREDENIGLLREMDKRIEENDFTAAAALRDQILANNGLESAYKNVLSLILKHEQSGLDANDSLELLSWATSCSFIYGKIPSVAQAAFNCIYHESWLFDEECAPNMQRSETFSNTQSNIGLDLTLYPNPSRDQLFVLSNNASIHEARCQIRGLDGRLIYEGPIDFEKGLALSNLSMTSGVYMIELYVKETNEIVHKQFMYLKE